MSTFAYSGFFLSRDSMTMIIDFPGGARVDAHFGPFTIATDQPPVASAPPPFALFLASIGTCAGIYVLSFCQRRGIDTDGIRIVQRAHSSADGMVESIDLEVQLPPEFPERYREAVIRAAEQCAVARHLERPPAIEVTTTRVTVPLLATA
jgi:ribosomal protein S12 methylthiotransferase accessory factor